VSGKRFVPTYRFELMFRMSCEKNEHVMVLDLVAGIRGGRSWHLSKTDLMQRAYAHA
jgi:hypothetical protein